MKLKIASLISLVFVTPAVAAESGYQVAIPRSRIEMPKLPEPTAPRVPDELELGASSWVPSHFHLPSGVQSASDFSRSSLPALSMGYLKPLAGPESPWEGLFLKTGLNWIALSREGKIGNESTAVTESQTLELLSLRIGAEYAPSLFQVLGTQPYVDLCLLPSLGMTGRSAFDDGSSYFGVPIEYSLGAQLDLHRIGLDFNQARLDLGVVGTVGTVDHSSVAGIGIKGGIRVAL